MRVLIVEDYRRAANVLDAILSAEGYTATICGTVTDALTELRAGRFDLVLLDIGLPGIDGWTALRIFRGLPGMPPVVVVSGQLDSPGGDTVKAISLGASACVEKPFSFEELIRVVEEVLAR